MCLAAGLFLENLTDIEGAKLIHDIEAASMPVFAVFFAVAGAGLHWDSSAASPSSPSSSPSSAPSRLLLGARVGMALGGVPARAAQDHPLRPARRSPASPSASRSSSQKHFAGWGKGASTCLFGAVMINEMIGPVLFRNALMRRAAKRAARRKPSH